MRLSPVVRFLLSIILLFSGAVGAQTPLPPPPGVCTNPLSPVEQRVVDATALMIPAGQLISNGNGTFRINWSNLLSYPSPADGICQSSAFYNRKTAGAGRTAVMIGKGTMLSAAHAVNFNPATYKIVFGPKLLSQPCSEFAWDNIPAENVYTPTAIGSVNIYSQNDRYDYITFNLDRNVVGRSPLKIRRSGKPAPGDPILLVSHPLWTSTTVLKGELTFADRPVGVDGLYWRYMFDGLYAMDGASGAAFYNLKDEVIDTGAAEWILAAYGRSTGCTDFYREPTQITTNGPTVDVSSQIPRSEILISPIVDVSHIGDVGGPLSNAVSSYSVAAVPGGSAVYSVSPVAGTEPGGPSLVTNPGPGSYLSIPVNSPPITITASSAGVSSCGIWDYTVNVRDVSNDQNNYLRHHFEIGMKEIEVGPDNRWDAAIFGSSVPASKFFEIRNLRPTATVVRARLSGASVPVSQSTFLVDGARDSVFTLQPKGQAGDTRSLGISVNGSGSLPAPGTTYNDGVVIEITDTSCALTDPISIPLSLRLGFQEFSMPASGTEVQSPTSANPQGTSEVIDFVASGTNGWCASQPQLEVGFLPMVGVGPPAPQLPAIASVLDIKLRSPDGTQAHLWDSNSISPQVVGAYVSNESTILEGYQVVGQVLRMNGGFSPALGPDSINLFNGKSVTGTWRLEIRKSANNGIVRPYRAKLKFNGTSCTP